MNEHFIQEQEKEMEKIYSSSKNLINEFHVFHREVEAWWHSFSFYHIHKRNILLLKWTNVVLTLDHISSQAELASYMYLARFDYEKYFANSKIPIKVSNPIEIWDSFGMKTNQIGQREHKILFDLMHLGLVENEPYDRILLYVSIGCTSDTIEDYKDLPYSFLLQVAKTVNGVNSN